MGQINPISELVYDYGKHSRKHCSVSTCHRAHIITTERIDSITGNEIIEKRHTPRTLKKYGGETLQYASVEKTRDYTGKLLRVYKRKRDRHKRVSFKEINYTRKGKVIDKKTGNHKRKVVKEYDENGKLVRHTKVNKRDFDLKKDLTRN